MIHLDMDCFFASVAALTDPSLQGLPLLVCHSNSAQGTGEVGLFQMAFPLQRPRLRELLQDL